MTMNTTTIKVALVGHDHAIEVNPNDHDDRIMRTTIEISKAGAILIRRYARKCRAPAIGVNDKYKKPHKVRLCGVFYIYT